MGKLFNYIPKAVLFDIDGTLINTGGAGHRALHLSLEFCTGIKDGFQGIEMAGRTDPVIIKEALKKWNIEINDSIVNEIIRKYITFLAQELTVSNNRRLMPGIVDLLNHITGDGVHVGLLTGNIEKGAELKLKSFEIDHYFTFGGFSSDDDNRNNLLPIALNKLYVKTGIRVLPHECLVIGDTPYDVTCAQPHGAKVIAVATGCYSFEDLSVTGAEWIFHDLGDTKQVLKKVFGTSL
jgi:phosphoglycolate phosphatase